MELPGSVIADYWWSGELDGMTTYSECLMLSGTTNLRHARADTLSLCPLKRRIVGFSAAKTAPVSSLLIITNPKGQDRAGRYFFLRDNPSLNNQKRPIIVPAPRQKTFGTHPVKIGQDPLTDTEA